MEIKTKVESLLTHLSCYITMDLNGQYSNTGPCHMLEI